ncbi:hypothetical protein CBL_13920 [Carabus blaptoides fortunei]
MSILAGRLGPLTAQECPLVASRWMRVAGNPRRIVAPFELTAPAHLRCVYVLLHDRNEVVEGRAYIPELRKPTRASYNITTHRLTSLCGTAWSTLETQGEVVKDFAERQHKVAVANGSGKQGQTVRGNETRRQGMFLMRGVGDVKAILSLADLLPGVCLSPVFYPVPQTNPRSFTPVISSPDPPSAIALRKVKFNTHTLTNAVAWRPPERGRGKAQEHIYLVARPNGEQDSSRSN